LVVRFVRSRGEERQQIKWFAYATVPLISYRFAERFLSQTFAPAASLVLGPRFLESL
jgi:hypothetical protein